MVARRIAGLLAFTFAAVGWGAPAAVETFELRAEFSKPKIYSGEIVSVQFVLYGTESVADVEVAKFPEFRGFWSENLTLRQGPMALSDLGPRGLHRAVIGAYTLTPMLGRKPRIEPMRVVVRKVGSAVIGGESLDSVIDPLTIQPLPAPPPAAAPYFVGGVGHFILETESPAVFFTPGEPTAVRWVLQGEGNFSEVNKIPWDAPGVKVLSTRTWTQGSGQYGVKVFEMMVLVDGAGTTKAPGAKLAYFDPVQAIYTVSEARGIEFQVQPRAPGEGGAAKSTPGDDGTDGDGLPLGPLESSLGAHGPLARSPLFWLAQLALGAALFGGAIARRRRRQRPAPAPTLPWTDVLAQPAGGALLARGADLARRSYAVRFGDPASLSLGSSDFLRRARERGWAPDALTAAERVFVIHAKEFSGAAVSQAEFQEFRECLRRLQSLASKK